MHHVHCYQTPLIATSVDVGPIIFLAMIPGNLHYCIP